MNTASPPQEPKEPEGGWVKPNDYWIACVHDVHFPFDKRKYVQLLALEEETHRDRLSSYTRKKALFTHLRLL